MGLKMTEYTLKPVSSVMLRVAAVVAVLPLRDSKVQLVH
jgi:hypothetical protein